MTAAQLIAQYVDAHCPRAVTEPHPGIVLTHCYLCAGRGSYRMTSGHGARDVRCANCAGKGTILAEGEPS